MSPNESIVEDDAIELGYLVLRTGCESLRTIQRLNLGVSSGRLNALLPKFLGENLKTNKINRK